ncbi:MAG: TlpA family protein disulfide reductase [Micromonosporaceae bacterium]
MWLRGGARGRPGGGANLGRRGRAAALVAAAAVAAGVFTGCAGEPSDSGEVDAVRDAAVRWFEPCPEPADASGAAADPESGSEPSPLPNLTLRCLGDDGRLDLSAPLGMPAVINVWASWCEPCRQELPAMQRYAEQNHREIAVLGVVTRDTYRAATSLAKDLDVTFPGLYDREGMLMRSLGRTALPLTLFVDANGRLAYLHNAEPLTAGSVAKLVDKHLATR